MKLNENPAIAYSPGERMAFAVLSRARGKPLAALEVAERVYVNGLRKPYHAARVVATSLKSLADKIEKNGEPFVVKKSERKGPYPINYWLEARGS